jgi:hypothetical protein
MDNKSMLMQTNMLLFFAGRDAVFLGGELVAF